MTYSNKEDYNDIDSKTNEFSNPICQIMTVEVSGYFDLDQSFLRDDGALITLQWLFSLYFFFFL